MPGAGPDADHERWVRSRAGVLRDRAGFSASPRRISPRRPTFEEIGIDCPGITGLLLRARGLVLVTRPTGSGKSVTPQAMVDWANEPLVRHIVTIGDPIEFLHRHRRLLLTQGDVGQASPERGRSTRDGHPALLVGREVIERVSAPPSRLIAGDSSRDCAERFAHRPEAA